MIMSRPGTVATNVLQVLPSLCGCFLDDGERWKWHLGGWFHWHICLAGLGMSFCQEIASNEGVRSRWEYQGRFGPLATSSMTFGN